MRVGYSKVYYLCNHKGSMGEHCDENNGTPSYTIHHDHKEKNGPRTVVSTGVHAFLYCLVKL